jgi:hypothetical protein
MNSWYAVLSKHYGMLLRPAPCDHCDYRQRCKEELLACDVFRAYANNNRHWVKERVPNRAIYLDVFEPKDKED